MAARNIRIPIRIITEKKQMRTDSIFYAGKSIAHVKILNRDYVLCAAGDYEFSIGNRFYNETSAIVKRLKDHGLASGQRSGKINVDNWGWFGINVWIDGHCQINPTDAYSTYDEAMKAFVKFVQEDIQRSTK